MLPLLNHTGLYFGSEDPLDPVERAHWHHHAMTRQACLELGWSPQAANESAWATAVVDLYSYQPVWQICGGIGRLRTARRIRPGLNTLHFDGLRSTAAVAEVWHRLLGGSLVALSIAADRGDVAAARHVIGIGLHAVQDFYSHSTWLNDPQRRSRTWLGSWERTADRPTPLPADLMTGTSPPAAGAAGPFHGEITVTPAALTRMPRMLITPVLDAVRPRTAAPARPVSGPPHGLSPLPPRGLRPAPVPGINLDTRWQATIGAAQRDCGLDADTAFETAYRLAVEDSRIWIGLLAEPTRAADPQFWEQVTAGPGHRWSDAFESRDLDPRAFLSAGGYPAQNHPDSHSWFLYIQAAPGGLRPHAARITLAGIGVEPHRRRLTGSAGWTVGPIDSYSHAEVSGLPVDSRPQVFRFRRAPVAQWSRLPTVVSADRCDITLGG